LDENELRAMQRDYAKVGRAVFIGTMKYEFNQIQSNSLSETLVFHNNKHSYSLCFCDELTKLFFFVEFEGLFWSQYFFFSLPRAKELNLIS
jgi:hypothetical protein